MVQNSVHMHLEGALHEMCQRPTSMTHRDEGALSNSRKNVRLAALLSHESGYKIRSAA